VKKLLPLILTAAGFLAPSAAFANDLYKLIDGNQPTFYGGQPTSVPANSQFAQHAHLVNSEVLPRLAGSKGSYNSSKGYENDANLFSYDLKILSRLTCGTAYLKCISDYEARSYNSRAKLLSTGNGDLIGTRPISQNVYQVTPNAWLVSSAYWPAHRYCKSIYGVSNAMNTCMGQQRRLAGF
jgi:hypothetical protein